MPAAAEKEIERIHAVINHIEMVGDAGLLKGFLNEEDIGYVVFHPQYLNHRLLHSSLFPDVPAIRSVKKNPGGTGG